jgi:ABC-type Na+ efflux pump permease subunit
MENKKMKRKDLNFNTIWTIGWKDIKDALTHIGTLLNILIVIGFVVFFWWSATPRPFDKKIDVAYFDQGNSTLPSHTEVISDGYQFRFYEVDTAEEINRSMGYKQLGILIPNDFDQTLASSGEAVLTGYTMWVFRNSVQEMENKYSGLFSQLLGGTVRVEIGDNVLVPEPGVHYNIVNFQILWATLFMALMVVPQLMLEEKQTKTLDALMVSPVRPGEMVAGKAVAGLFYMVISGGLYLILNQAYVINWWLAGLAFLCVAVFSIGLALLFSGFIKNPQMIGILVLPVVAVLLIPAMFQQEEFLIPALRKIFGLMPTSAMVEIMGFSFSSYAPTQELLVDMAIILASIVLVYAGVIWQIRRLDR